MLPGTCGRPLGDVGEARPGTVREADGVVELAVVAHGQHVRIAVDPGLRYLLGTRGNLARRALHVPEGGPLPVGGPDAVEDRPAGLDRDLSAPPGLVVRHLGALPAVLAGQLRTHAERNTVEHRLLHRAVALLLVVQVGPRGLPRAPDYADLLPAGDALPDRDVVVVQVGVQRLGAAAVVDDHVLAVAGRQRLHDTHGAVGAGEDRLVLPSSHPASSRSTAWRGCARCTSCPAMSARS